MNEYLNIWHQIKDYLDNKYVTCECDFDPFFEELVRRKNMSDALKDDYYDGRSGSDKIQMPGASDQDAYDMLREVAKQLDRCVIKSCSKDQMLGLANEIYTFLGKKGQ